MKRGRGVCKANRDAFCLRTHEGTVVRKQLCMYDRAGVLLSVVLILYGIRPFRERGEIRIVATILLCIISIDARAAALVSVDFLIDKPLF